MANQNNKTHNQYDDPDNQRDKPNDQRLRGQNPFEQGSYEQNSKNNPYNTESQGQGSY